MNMTRLLSVANMLSFGKKWLSSQNSTKFCKLTLKFLNSRGEEVISVIPQNTDFGVQQLWV